MRRAFVQSQQPLTREDLDNRITLNRREKYWNDVAKLFSNPETAVQIDVKSHTVCSYLDENLDVSHRRSVSAGECKKQYTSIRSTYESSDALARYRQSGQGNPDFFPNFCCDNPTNVFYHYIIQDARSNGEGEVVIASLSLMDPTKHVNSMDMPGATMEATMESTLEAEEDEWTPEKRSKKNSPSRKSFMKRLNKTLDTCIQEYSPSPKKRAKVDVMDVLQRKIRVKKMRMQLRQLQEVDPDSDYERDNDLLDTELGEVNTKLKSFHEQKHSAPAIPDVSAISSTADASAVTTISSTSDVSAVTKISSTPTPLNNFIWRDMLPSDSSKHILSMLNTIPHSRFRGSRGGDEGFEGETSVDLGKTQKKVCIVSQNF